MKPIPLLLPLLLPLLSFSADAHAVFPSSVPAPVGPYSPGVVVGEYLYVSGQGAHRPDGSMPDTFAEQVRQTLENVKAVLEAGGFHDLLHVRNLLGQLLRFSLLCRGLDRSLDHQRSVLSRTADALIVQIVVGLDARFEVVFDCAVNV